MIKWIFIVLGIVIFFTVLMPGCIKGCNRQVGIEKREDPDNTEKEDDEEEQDSTEETSGPGIIEQIFGHEKVTVEQTFWVVTYSDEAKTQIVENIHCVTPWRDIINPKLWYDIIPDSAQTIQITPPGWYEKNTIWHQSPTVTYHGEFKGHNVANPPIGPRGDGPFIIISPVKQ